MFSEAADSPLVPGVALQISASAAIPVPVWSRPSPFQGTQPRHSLPPISVLTSPLALQIHPGPMPPRRRTRRDSSAQTKRRCTIQYSSTVLLRFLNTFVLHFCYFLVPRYSQPASFPRIDHLSTSSTPFPNFSFGCLSTCTSHFPSPLKRSGTDLLGLSRTADVLDTYTPFSDICRRL